MEPSRIDTKLEKLERVEWWLSCTKFTVWVEVEIQENDSEIITDTARVTQKFIGQRFDNLKLWFRKFGDYKAWKFAGPTVKENPRKK